MTSRRTSTAQEFWKKHALRPGIHNISFRQKLLEWLVVIFSTQHVPIIIKISHPLNNTLFGRFSSEGDFKPTFFSQGLRITRNLTSISGIMIKETMCDERTEHHSKQAGNLDMTLRNVLRKHYP